MKLADMLRRPTPPTDSGDSRCPDCGHDQSGILHTRWREPLCGYEVADYGFGDVDTCECTNAVHVLTARDN